jgi:hypothetical protein
MEHNNVIVEDTDEIGKKVDKCRKGKLCKV